LALLFGLFLLNLLTCLNSLGLQSLFISLDKLLRIGCIFNIIIGARTQLRNLTVIKLHIQKFQILLVGKLNDNLMFLLIPDDPPQAILLEDGLDLVIGNLPDVVCVLDNE
jgi:hypothetical protein